MPNNLCLIFIRQTWIPFLKYAISIYMFGPVRRQESLSFILSDCSCALGFYWDAVLQLTRGCRPGCLHRPARAISPDISPPPSLRPCYNSCFMLLPIFSTILRESWVQDNFRKLLVKIIALVVFRHDRPCICLGPAPPRCTQSTGHCTRGLGRLGHILGTFLIMRLMEVLYIMRWPSHIIFLYRYSGV